LSTKGRADVAAQIRELDRLTNLIALVDLTNRSTVLRVTGLDRLDLDIQVTLHFDVALSIWIFIEFMNKCQA